MAIKKKKYKGTIEIDLTGPDGNAFVLLGHAKNYSKQIGLPWDKIKDCLLYTSPSPRD